MEFEEAFECIVKFEGGFVNDKDDTGGVTKYGISKASYPSIDIGNLTLDDAKAIYRRDFWDKLHLDQLHSSIRLALFDSAINCGPGTSIKFLQEALHVPTDGMLGPNTIQKLEERVDEDRSTLVAEIMFARFKKVSALPNASKYIGGWTKRMMEVIALSV